MTNFNVKNQAIDTNHRVLLMMNFNVKDQTIKHCDLTKLNDNNFKVLSKINEKRITYYNYNNSYMRMLIFYI